MEQKTKKSRIAALLLCMSMLLLLFCAAPAVLAADGESGSGTESGTTGGTDTQKVPCAETDCGGTYQNGFCTVCGAYQPAVLNDNGTEDDKTDDYYEISNAGQLYWFADFVNKGGDNMKANAKLTANITVNSGVLNTDGTLNEEKKDSFRVWTPIKDNGNSYKGTFDGTKYDESGKAVGNYTISGLYFNNSSSYRVGLFGEVGYGGKVQNIGIEDSYFYGHTYVGGVVGLNRGTVMGCYNSGAVNGRFYVSGVVGENFRTVTNCYNTGTVSGSGPVGGVVGDNQSSTVTNCYNTGTVSGSGTVGGVVGYITGTGGTVSNCYYLSGTASTGIGSGAGEATAMTKADFASGKVTYLLNGSTSEGDLVWKQPLSGVYKASAPSFVGHKVIDNGDGTYKNDETETHDFTGGHGFCVLCGAKCEHDSETDGKCDTCGLVTAPEPTQNGDGYYEIWSADQLYWFASKVNGGSTSINGKLMTDIVLQPALLAADGSLNTYYTENPFNVRNWTPIGNSSKSYTGTFDGNWKTISGLYYNSSTDYVGLFGVVGKGGNVKNVAVKDSYISGDWHVGGIVGRNSGDVTNCYNTGYVSGGSYIGGVVGTNDEGTITNCYNTGNNVGDWHDVGGVVGYNASGNVVNCYNTGDVTSGRNGNTAYHVGGVVGSTVGKVVNCYNTGMVSCNGNFIGSVAGSNNAGTVTNCYYLTGCAKDGNETIQYGIGNETVGQSTEDVAGQTAGCNADDFKSGKVAYLLGGGVTDGTQAWYQTCGTGLPSLDSKAGTVYKKTNNGCSAVPDQFSNTDGESFEGEHTFDENGFCACGGYEAPTLKNGYYEIDNAGKLYWFADYVNKGSDNRYANAKLTADIDLKNSAWTAIGTETNPYTGTFDGGDFTISNISMTVTSHDGQGLFGAVSGGTIKNFTIKGEIKVSATVNNIGGVVGYAKNKAVVENVTSYVNITDIREEPTKRNNRIGGIVGYLDSGSTVNKCVNQGDITFANGYVQNVSGIVGWAADNDANCSITYCDNHGKVTAGGDSAHVGGVLGGAGDYGATVRYCINYGDVTSGGGDCVGGVVAYVKENSVIEYCGNMGKVNCTVACGSIGGVLGYVRNSSFKSLANCFNYGTVTDSVGWGAAIVGNCKDPTNTSVFKNNYYLEGSCTVASGNQTISNVYSATEDEFKSGEVAYKLNGEKTDGAWKQAIGSLTFDFTSENTVYAGYKPCSDTLEYSNDPAALRSAPHIAGDSYDAHGFCTACGKGYQPATLNSDGVYEIGNVGQLYWFAGLVNGTLTGVEQNTAANAKLTADIDLAGYDWTPIGLYSDSGAGQNPYAGTFDGQYHVIKHLYVTLDNTFEAGLFSRVSKGTLKNFGVIDATVTQNGKDKAENGIRSGIIAGEIYMSTVENVFTAGELSVTTTHDQWGGLAGESAKSTLKNCFTTYGRLTATGATTDHCYYLADAANTASAGEHKTKTEFESGVVAWLLNGENADDYVVWKQALGTNGDAYPNFASKDIVYSALDCGDTRYYTNDEPTGTKHTAFDENGFCACGQSFEPCKGSGTAGDPYLIKNAGNLYWFAAEVNGGETGISAKLTANIVVNENVLKEDGSLNGNNFRVWTPIGNPYGDDEDYSGSFDGAGHTVSGLYVKRSNNWNSGLFGCIANGGTVKNLGVKDSYIEANGNAGGVVGHNQGAVTNCYNTGYVNGTHAGGVVGYNYGAVTNCYNTGNVSGEDVGGVVGYNYGAVTNCYYLSGTASVGIGAVDTYHTAGTDAVGVVEAMSSDEFKSGAVTWLLNGKKSDENVVWKQTLTGKNADATPNFTSKDIVYSGYEKCKDARIYTNDKDMQLLGAPHIYVNGFCTYSGCYEPAVLNNNGTEDDTSDDYYEISNAGQLYWFAALVNGTLDGVDQDKFAHAKLTANIIVNPGTFDKDGNYTPGENEATGTTPRTWTSIFFDWNYQGCEVTFDGCGHTVSGLYYSSVGSDSRYCVGLFGNIAGNATVKNVGVVNGYFNVSGDGVYVGGVVGYNTGGTVENCYSTCTITGAATGNYGVYAGGVVGYNTGTVENCYSTCTIACAATGNYKVYAGGVVGYNSGIVQNCYNTESVTCTDTSNITYVGGVVGYNSGTVQNCYNTGSVTCTYTDNAPSVGGVVGTNGNTVKNCYNTGKVTCEGDYVGGVAGYNGNTITNCYYLAGTASTGIGDNGSGEATSKTSTDFTSGMVTWLLNGKESGENVVWKQTLTGENADATPNFTSKEIVYGGYVKCDGSTKFGNKDDVTGTSSTIPEHSFDTDGFCTKCSVGYQPAAKNGEYYEISNVGQLYWFAAEVNGGNNTINGKLTADITVNKNVLKSDGSLGSGEFRVWTPIGTEDTTFMGKFDGDKHTVSGLYFNDTSKEYVGLFGYVGMDREGVADPVYGEVKNVTVKDSYFGGRSNVGGIAGACTGAVIEYCANYATVYGVSENIGGIVGYVSDGAWGFAREIRYCYNVGKVSGGAGSSRIGGVVGYNAIQTVNSPSILYCYNVGSVSGNNSTYVGGVIGCTDTTDDNKINNCYYLTDCASDGTTPQNGVGCDTNGSSAEELANGPIYLIRGYSADEFASGKVTWLLNGERADNVVWKQTLGPDASPNFRGSDTEYDIVYRYKDCMENDRFANTKTNDGRHVYDDNGFCCAKNSEGGVCGAYVPCGQDETGIYLIYNAGNLYWFAQRVNFDYNNTSAINAILMANITVNPGTFDKDGNYTPGKGEAAGTQPRFWTPIGNRDNTYTGTFGGQGHTISGLYCNSDDNYVGLFGYAENATIVDVALKNSYIKGSGGYVGGIVGCAEVYSDYTLTISGCSVDKNSFVIAKDDLVGGIVGYARANDNATLTIQNCYNAGNVGGSSNVGGVVGYAYTYSGATLTVQNCYNTGDVTVNNSYAGGVVGRAYVIYTAKLTVQNCYNTGDVTANDMFIGGVVGSNDGGSVKNCYYLTGCAIDSKGMKQNGIGNKNTVEATADVEGCTTAMTSDEFKSGAVTYLLNGGKSDADVVWRQTIGARSIPGFIGSIVSYDETQTKYYNDAAVAGYTLYLKGKIGVNFYLKLTDDFIKAEDKKIVFTCGDTSEEPEFSEGVKTIRNGETYYVFTYYVTSDQMTEDIMIECFIGDTCVTRSTTTVKYYAMYIVNHPDAYSADSVKFAKALLNYGAAAQMYFGTNTSKLANASLPEADRTITEPGIEKLEQFKLADNSWSGTLGTFTGTTLTLEAATALNAYFEPADGVNIEDITFTVTFRGAEKEITPMAKKTENGYVLEFGDIKAYELGKDATFTAKRGDDKVIFTCSAMTYVYNVISAPEGIYDAELKTLVSALYYYMEASQTIGG